MEVDLERTNKLNELAKIRAEIDELLIQKAEIVRDINIPIYKAKAEAEKIISNAQEEFNATVSAANKILKDAEEKHAQAADLLHTANNAIEEIKAGQAKLAQDKIDFDDQKFAQDNANRAKKNEIYEQERQFKENNDILQQKLIEVKQREELASRREEDIRQKINMLESQQDTLDLRSKTLDEYSAKIEAQKKVTEEKEAENLDKEKVLEGIRTTIEEQKTLNQKILDETIQRKTDLTRQQNDLARQIEIMDASKIEVDEKMKALKEQQRLIELKIRQNDEKLATLKQLREEGK